jgi:hypothetical protein
MLTRFLNDMPMHYDSQVRYQICKFCLFNRTNPNIGCIFFRFFPVEHHNCNVIKNAVCIRRSPKKWFLVLFKPLTERSVLMIFFGVELHK